MEWDLNTTLFEISCSDPATQLRQFMHDLFQKEIEEEQWGDSDQTVYAEDQQEYIRKRTGSRSTGKKRERSGKNTRPWSRTAYMGVVAMAAGIFALGILLFATRGIFPGASSSVRASSQQTSLHRVSGKAPTSTDVLNPAPDRPLLSSRPPDRYLGRPPLL